MVMKALAPDEENQRRFVVAATSLTFERLSLKTYGAASTALIMAAGVTGGWPWGIAAGLVVGANHVARFWGRKFDDYIETRTRDFVDIHWHTIDATPQFNAMRETAKRGIFVKRRDGVKTINIYSWPSSLRFEFHMAQLDAGCRMTVAGAVPPAIRCVNRLIRHHLGN